MPPCPSPDRPDLVAEFGEHAYHHLIYTLRKTLPPPPTDDPEALLRRDHAAIARIAALCPANPAEADTAGLYVAASEQWKECLRLAQLPETTPQWAMKCRNQANAMMRQSQGALRLLLRMQTVREKREATNQSCDRAAFTEYWNTTLMAEALGARPSPAVPPPLAVRGQEEGAGAPADPPAPPPASAPEPATTAEPCPAPLTAAQEYAILYPQRASLIRHMGRVPDDISFGPPEDAVVQALIAARDSTIATLDHHAAKPATS